MVIRNLIDSVESLVRGTVRRPPLDANTEANPNGCPPEWPVCGPGSQAGDPASALPEQASPVAK
jgi:hypothetical protein